MLAAVVAGSAHAQTGKVNQVVKPPESQAWIDVATFAGMGMPGMGMSGMGSGGMDPMKMAMGGMMGNSQGRNVFGNTQTGALGRWVDVTLSTRRNPSLKEATQAVPAGTGLAPSLKLVAPKVQTPPPADDDQVVEAPMERPKGKLYLYWGCSETVRAGQPAVLDMATATPQDYAKFFVSRRATQRGTHAAVGRPVWPNDDDSRMVPATASLVGEHAYSGDGVPASFKFAIPAAQDLMPAIQLRQTDAGGATQLEWAALPTARAYFLAAMGAKGGSPDQPEMVFWSSSELPEIGMGLVDYQTNPAVEGWLKEKVLLPSSTTRCAVPKGIFGDQGAGMLRMIAYGSELNLSYPPRPEDPKVPWEPEWAVKVRVKSVANAMLGMDMGDMPGAAMEAPPSGEEPADQPEEPAGKPGIKPTDILKGIFGR